MRNLLLTSLLIVAVVFNSFASTTLNTDRKTIALSTDDNTSTEVMGISTENLNYYNVIRHLKTNSFVKLIQLNDYDAIKNLIEAGVNINKKSVGLTPLMYAARQNKVAFVKLLLENGAKLKTRSKNGFTALDYARMSHATESYYLIKEAL